MGAVRLTEIASDISTQCEKQQKSVAGEQGAPTMCFRSVSAEGRS